MSQIHQVSRGRRRMAWPNRLLLVVSLFWLRQPAGAHSVFTNYVQHSVHLAVGVQHLDLTLDLTFFEEWSARERQAMDADANGRISRSELEGYLKQLAPRFAERVKLRVAGRELELVPLYAPEVDLLSDERVGPGHHRLRLFFFAPTPARLRANDEVAVADGLWPEAKFLGTVAAEGRDGCTLTTEISIPPGLEAARPEPTRGFKFRCLKPPLIKAATSNRIQP